MSAEGHVVNTTQVPCHRYYQSLIMSLIVITNNYYDTVINGGHLNYQR